jgi:hypothetical protein
MKVLLDENKQKKKKVVHKEGILKDLLAENRRIYMKILSNWILDHRL